MSRFEDVERFVREHRSCGTLTPRTSPPIGGKHRLSLSCSCGKQLDRWVGAGDDAETPTAAPGDSTPAAEPEAIDITPVTTGDESLEDVMRQALESLQTARPAAPSTTPPLPVTPPPAVATPPSAPPPLAPPAAPAISSPTPDAPLGRPPSPPRRASDPLRPAAPRPASPRSANPQPAAGSAPPLERGALEEALRATLDALNAGEAAEPTPPTRPSRAPAWAAERPALETAPGGGAGPRPPDKHALQGALQTTLSALEAERKTAPRGGRPGATPVSTAASPRRRRRLGVPGALGISLALIAAVGVGYLLHAVGQNQPARETPAAHPPPGMRVAESERAAVSRTVAVLRDLQSISGPDVRYRFYFDRVSFAKGDVERQLGTVRDPEVRRALGETIALHVLAANAWRAKTLNERDKWEAVGDDPTSELCPGAKRVLAVSDEPPNMSRAQWRGHALAAAVPLLWDCARDRLAEVERGLNQR